MQTSDSPCTPIRWMMIETLDPAVVPTLVSDGDRGRDFTAIHRVFERSIKSTRLASYITPEDLCGRIISTRDRGEPTDVLIGKGKHCYAFRTLPVFGPNDRVHGVQYWFGPRDQEPPEPRHATGAVWDLATRMVHLTIECTRMAGIPEAGFVPELPLATFWRYASRFDHHETVFNLLYHPHERAKLQTQGAIRHAEGREMLWQATIRARYDKETIGGWALLEDLTSENSQPPTETLEQRGLREYLRSTGAYLGVIHIPDGTVVQWLTDPPPWIDCTRAPDQLFPPEDHARLTTAVAPDEGVVRVLNPDNSYTPTKIVLLPYHGRRKGPFAIGRFLRADGHAACAGDHADCGTNRGQLNSC